MHSYTVWWVFPLLYILPGGVPTPLKNMSSSIWMTIPNICKKITCSKPPTSMYKYIYNYGNNGNGKNGGQGYGNSYYILSKNNIYKYA